MPKYIVSVDWKTEVLADSMEEALDSAYYTFEDFDFARDAKITKRRK